MIVFIDRQHSGNPRRLRSLGASSDANDDGVTEIHEMEAIWTARYGIEVEIGLRMAGIDVIPISDGTYYQRHQRVNSYVEQHPTKGPFVYLALHCNAAGPRAKYGAFFWDYRSQHGKLLAEYMAKSLQDRVGPIQTGRAIKAQPEGWTKNALYCIKGVSVPIGICCEPLFLDSIHHKRLLSQGGMVSIGKAIAAGIIAWRDNYNT